jgi:class 3 adenylate cyclase/tetratricopeptide (TPR) repeat protein
MAEQRDQRRLAAILSADVVGYSRLMEEDEAGTLAALKDLRGSLVDRKMAEFRGRIVKLMGDGTLAEFASVVDAVQCAVELQREIAARNAQIIGDRRIDLRIGVNLGDVIPDGDDIYGAGVNVAARLEAMAEPGGIFISGTVHDAIGGDLAQTFEFIGELSMKNIAKPVRAYRHLGAPRLMPMRPGPSTSARRPTEPSLAVKPFENLSGDPEQDVFANAMSNGIMAALTRVPGLTLVQDESPFLTMSSQMGEQELARRFAAQYLLKGDLRKLGDRVRVSTVLMEVATGKFLFAEKFDGDLSDYDDLFALQDEITEQILDRLDVKLFGGEAVRIVRRMFKIPAALESYFQGEYLVWNAKSGLDLQKAQHLLEEAIWLEPTSSASYAAGSIAYWAAAFSSPEARAAQLVERAEWLAREAIRLGDATGYPHMVLAHLHLSRREFEDANDEAERAVAARPSCPASFSLKAGVLNYLGRSGEAIEHAEFALRLMPLQSAPIFPAVLASALYGSGRYDEAIEAAKSAIEIDEKNVDPYLVLAESSIALGRSEEARQAASVVKKIQPEFSLEKFAKSQPYKDPDRLDQLLGQLRQAGLE